MPQHNTNILTRRSSQLEREESDKHRPRPQVPKKKKVKEKSRACMRWSCTMSKQEPIHYKVLMQAHERFLPRIIPEITVLLYLSTFVLW